MRRSKWVSHIPSTSNQMAQAQESKASGLESNASNSKHKDMEKL
jgi:hypothetical protein